MLKPERITTLTSRVDRFLDRGHAALAAVQRAGRVWRLALNHGPGVEASLNVHAERWVTVRLALPGPPVAVMTPWSMVQRNGVQLSLWRMAAGFEDPMAYWIGELTTGAASDGAEGDWESGLGALLEEAGAVARWAQGGDAAPLDAGPRREGEVRYGGKGVSWSGGEARSVSDLRDLLQACGMGRWPTFDRAGALGVELDCPANRYIQATAAVEGAGVQLRVELFRGPTPGAESQVALARLLLAASATIRLVRGGVRRLDRGAPAPAGPLAEPSSPVTVAADEVAVELATSFSVWPSAGQLDDALSALSVACRLVGADEVRALMDPACARCFLDRVEPWSCGMAA